MQRIIRRTLIALLSILCLLILGIWGLGPYVAKDALTKYFAEHNADFSAESLSINPFTSEINGRGVKVTTPRGLELKFEALQVSAQLAPLFENTVVVDKIALDGLQLNIAQEQEGWRVAGVLFPTGVEESATPAPESAGEDWTISLPSIQLRNCAFNISRLPPADAADQAPLQDEIRLFSLNLKNIKGKGAEWNGFADVMTQVNGADIVLATEFRVGPDKFVQWLDISSLKARMQQFAHYLPADLRDSNASLDLSAEIVVDWRNGALTLTTTTKKLDISQVDLKLKDMTVESDITSIDLNPLQINLAPGGDPEVAFNGKIHSGKTRVNDSAGRYILAGWDKLDLTPVSFSMDEALNVKVDQISSQNLVLSRSALDNEELPPLLQAGTLFVSNVEASDKRAFIEMVELSDIRSNVHLDKERNLITLAPLSANSPSEAASQTPQADAQTDAQSAAETPPASEAPENSPFNLVINQISIKGDSLLSFIDEGVKPPFQQDIRINSLVAESLTTENPEQAFHVTLDAQTDQYSKIQSDTRIWPFAPKLSLDTRTNIAEINLPPVSPYLSDALGYDINNGQFDMNLAMIIDEGRISGDTKIMLRGMDLGADKSADANAIQKGGAIPLNVALGMLKDGNGNVELAMPLSGDVDSPSFGWSGFVALIAQKAIFEAASGYLIKTFVPYANVVTVVKFAGEQALKVRIQPLPYQAGQSDVGPEQQAFVNEFRQLLLDKEDMQVKTCAIASPAELNYPSDTKALTVEQLKTLKQLAEERGQKFKAKVLEGGKIASSRILLCNPEVEKDSDGKGRIEFEI
ncbi:protein of unknown function (DUF748) [Hahella chejuensis KCTC 2396]|uniref:DUF748 domain-containing protein n=1 Tax=Hahella chejuensis (strain KCTC 2396) TaxID=349521 RepID=Q2SLU1_HAHCH|nr:DUF748 domain-containing protein [Hahella chejuensis]ABC28383.1 protein of unknown function (DUF748) [Hahella chejuensis KCTC 2396]